MPIMALVAVRSSPQALATSVGALTVPTSSRLPRIVESPVSSTMGSVNSLIEKNNEQYPTSRSNYHLYEDLKMTKFTADLDKNKKHLVKPVPRKALFGRLGKSGKSKKDYMTSLPEISATNPMVKAIPQYPPIRQLPEELPPRPRILHSFSTNDISELPPNEKIWQSSSVSQLNKLDGEMVIGRPLHTLAHHHRYSSHSSDDTYSSEERSQQRKMKIPSPVTEISTSQQEMYVDDDVQFLKDRLAKKEHALLLLRDTMEKNEESIFAVHRQKETGWRHQMKEVRGKYDDKIHVLNRKIQQMEEFYQYQLHLLQREKNWLSQELTEMKTLKERFMKLNSVKANNLNQTDEKNNAANELQMVKGQYNDLRGELSQRNAENFSLRNQQRDLSNQLKQKDTELVDLHQQLLGRDKSFESLTETNTTLCNDLARIQQKVSGCEEELERVTEQLRHREYEANVLDNKLHRKESQVEDLQKQLQHQEYKLKSPCGSTTSPVIILQSSPKHRGSPRSGFDSPGSKASYSSGNGSDREREVHDRDTIIRRLNGELEKMRSELCSVKKVCQAQNSSFQSERQRWEDEKQTVIRFQKQLQSKYSQLIERNHTLEDDIENLRRQLENKNYHYYR